jgi:hypothetical protein
MSVDWWNVILVMLNEDHFCIVKLCARKSIMYVSFRKMKLFLGLENKYVSLDLSSKCELANAYENISLSKSEIDTNS